MKNEELKAIANTLSDVFISSPDDFTERFETIVPKDITAYDGYVIGRLADVYRKAKTGGMSKDEAVKEQKRIFEKGLIYFDGIQA